MRSGVVIRAIRGVSLRSSLADVRSYRVERGTARVDLSANTNRWGMPPAARDAIARARDADAGYPDAFAEPLKEAIGAYLGVPAGCVVTGCGSDDVLDSAIRAFADPASRVAIASPTFPMIARFARLNALAAVEVPLRHTYDLDVDDMLACDPRVVYACAPNNPTGTLVSRQGLESVAERVDGVLIVDEAYAEFAGVSAVDLASSMPNVLVVRTMSKAFGLAGLRVGYGVGAPELVSEVEKSRGPYKVSSVGAAAAIAALRDDLAWVGEHVALALRARERLAGELRRRALTPIASRANFVCVPIPGAARIAAAMRELGVLVRAYDDLALISPALRATDGSALRISVGPWSEMQAALDALDTVLER